MASDDNVRTIYRDGLLLGKDELEDDQNYFRAALERRSLSRDMYGIAWGLELALVDGSPTITPGVAYGGDGKVMIVRRPLNIAEKFARKPEGEYAIHLYYLERENPLSAFTFCNQEIDPRMAEGFEVELGDVALTIREKARFEPHQQLPAQPKLETSRVRLGVIEKQANGFTIKATDRELLCDPPTVSSKLQPEPAQYIGVVGAAFTHPKRWTASAKPDQKEVDVAFEIDPDGGIYVNDPLIARRALIIPSPDAKQEVLLKNDGELVVEVCVRKTDGTIESKEVLKARPGMLEAPEDLTVGGTSTLTAVTAANVSISADLTIADTATLTVKGKATFEDEATFEGKINAKNELAVAGAVATLTNQTTDPNNPKTALGVSGRAIFNKDNQTNLAMQVNGRAEFNEQVTFNDPVTFQDPITFAGGAPVFQQGAEFQGPAKFEKLATFNDPVVLTDSLTLGPTISGAANFTGDVSTTGTLAVSGYALLKPICILVPGFNGTLERRVVGFDASGAPAAPADSADSAIGIGVASTPTGWIVAVAGVVDVLASKDIVAGERVMIDANGTIKPWTTNAGAAKCIGRALQSVTASSMNPVAVSVLLSFG